MTANVAALSRDGGIVPLDRCSVHLERPWETDTQTDRAKLLTSAREMEAFAQSLVGFQSLTANPAALSRDGDIMPLSGGGPDWHGAGSSSRSPPGPGSPTHNFISHNVFID